MTLERISEVLRRRGVKRVVHFHTDHFEPWRPFPGRENDPSTSIAAVERFIEMTSKVELTRRQTLFYKGLVNYDLNDSRELHRADPDDRIGFIPQSESDAARSRHVLQALAGAGHELQLHIHHENFNFTSRPPQDETQRYLAEDGWRHDAARLELSILLNLDAMRRACGKPDAVWFFIHGHWALNASDVHECTVVREIELLMRNGCAGDFTFPAGRDHVDSRADTPFLVRPVPLPMGYDRREAGAVQAHGAGQVRDRFFIWQTAQRHRLCSLDYYSPFVRKRFEDPAATALALAEIGTVLGDTLYHKTHSHSVHPRYWETDQNPLPPLLHPGARAELGLLFDAASAAGAAVEFSTAAAVFRQVTGAPSAPAPPPEPTAEPMAGRESIAFVDSAGRPAGAPPLPPQLTAIPAPAARTPRAAGAAGEVRPVIVQALAPAEPSTRTPAARADLGDLADRVDAAASAAARQRRQSLGAEASGVTGFYETRANDGAMLSPAERALAEHVLATPGVSRAYEIGAGMGVLTLLVAAGGKEAIGIERHSGRHDTSLALHAAVAQAIPGAGPRARLVKGKFPHVCEFDTGLDRSAALLTNLLGGADFEEQLQVILGLRRFKYLFVDLTKFYERRPDAARQRELIRLFRVAGFSEPRDLFDLGDDGKYVLFINPSPLQSSLPEVLYRRARRGLTRAMKRWRKA